MSLSADNVQNAEVARVDSNHYPTDFVINNVHVTPPSMLFENAYEGKKFYQTITIQNCGSHLAFVRMGPPTSSMFHFKYFKEGIYIAPGMKITRRVGYKYTSAMGTLQGFASIWVEEEEREYYFNVTLSAAVLSVEPQQLDFGRSDAANHAISRTFIIKNDGVKGAQFSIDLGINPLDLLVEPLRGTVAAMSSVTISVEIISSREARFMEEIWVKTTPPLRVVITGEFIAPRLLIRRFVNSLDFTLMEFPPTYYGSTFTQSLLLKNFSSSHSMFCVMAEIKGTIMTLDEARQIDDNYKNFLVRPLDGRMAAHRGSVIQITFKPWKSPAKNKVYAACFLKVIRMDCRDINEQDGVIVNKIEQRMSITDVASCASRLIMTETNKMASITLGPEEEKTVEDTGSFEHTIGVCLHGEKESVDVSLRPTTIELNELTLNRVYQREVRVTNNSTRLPVRVKYRKIPSIDVRPNQFDLKPSASFEVLISVRSFKLDRVEKRVTFDLMGKDCPESGSLFRKVGVTSFLLSFETTAVVERTRVGRCHAIELENKLEPEFPFRLSEAALTKKIQNEEYYLKYIRNLQKLPLKILEDKLEYALTIPKLQKCRSVSPKREMTKSFTSFIPLAPRLLYHVKVMPKSIKLQKVAANTTINDCLTIQNNNTFPIHVFIMSSKPAIVFEYSRHFIGGNQTKKIYFSFSNNKVGRYYININILVNGFALYEITAVAHVVPKTITVDSTLIEFTEKDENFKFIKLTNAVNAYASFDWEVPEGSFSVHPKDGGIQAKSFILCMVTYHPNLLYPKENELALTSESGQTRVVAVTYVKRPHLVVLDTYEIDLGVVPLNIPILKKLTLKNLKGFPILYSIPNGVPVPGVTIEPQEGVLLGLDSQVFNISIKIDSLIQFSCEIVFNINDDELIGVAFKGIVDYPKILFKPSTLYFRKISPFSFDSLAFKVKNESKCESHVSFPFDEYPEFTITAHENTANPHVRRITLLPSEAKVLFLHFHPKHVSTFLFYLPYVINDILGPVHINSNRSASPLFFLRRLSRLSIHTAKMVAEIPRNLPVIRINSQAVEKAIEFSNLNINFLFFGEDHYSNVTNCDFEITNVKSEIAEICIRVDDLDSPFSLTVKDEEDANIEFYDVSYKITLQPGEKISFMADFTPVNLGKYSLKLPIFLRGYYDNKIFNYLTLRGVYGRPTIIPSTKRCDFEPIPLRFTNEISLTLRMYNHFENCDLFVDADVLGLFASFEKDKTSTKDKIVLDVTLCYDYRRISCFSSQVSFQCSCGASCTLVATGVTENCLLTTHAFSHLLKRETKVKSKSLVFLGDQFEDLQYVNILVNKNTTCFPLFPKSDDHSPYAVYMRSIQKTLENWLFSQAFYKKCYYRIPEGFSDFCKVFEPPKKMVFGGFKIGKLGDLPLLELIANIAGRSIRQLLAPKFPKRNEEKDWLIYTHKTNLNILQYLHGFSVFIPHVEAKFLLNYQQYLLFQKYKHPKEKPFEEATFYRLSKQCWIDMLLQMIKVFFLYRSVCLPFHDELETPQPSHSKFKYRQSISALSRTYSDEEGEDILDIGVYGKHEKELLFWLQESFDSEKDRVWSTPPEDKNVIFLDEDLRDGLVLGAVTARYCPYLRSEIAGMYSYPQNPEEITHNCCVLIHTWQMLNFSYVITPLDLQKCGMVEMLLLVNYLYVVLPNYTPREEVTIEALLTQTNTASIDLENVGTDLITYKVGFFGNVKDLFYAGQKWIKIQPRATKTVHIRYHAKSVETAIATLMFSGETPGSKYAKSVVVSLKGVADVSYACMQIPVVVDMYKPCSLSIQVTSPFKVRAQYTIYFGYQHAVKGSQVLFPWEEVKNLKTIKEYFLSEAHIEFDDSGSCVAKEVVCCRQQGPRNFWFYFTNPDVGDWGIQIILTGRVTESCYEKILVDLPDNYEDLVCRCKGKPSVLKNCPLILHAHIPMMNNLLWNARKTMLLHHVEGEELTFWSKRIYSPIGTRILKLLLNSETHPIRETIEDSMEYKVDLERPSPLVTLKTVVIEDVISSDYYDLPIHLVKNLSQVEQCVLRLMASTGRETRYYKLIFDTSNRSINYVKEDQ